MRTPTHIRATTNGNGASDSGVTEPPIQHVLGDRVAPRLLERLRGRIAMHDG